MKIQFQYTENSISIQRNSNPIIFNEIQVQFKENSKKIHVNAQSILGGTSGDLPKLFPPFQLTKWRKVFEILQIRWVNARD